MTLVAIPWQPHLFVTPDTLALLVAASARRGRNLYLVGDDAAWRPYEVQARYSRAWLAYKAFLAGGKWAPKANPASDPDKGLRQHLRGAAFDLRDTDTATQNACRAVGLVRDGVEAWHWNNPRWASMPIIKTNTTVSGGKVTPLPAEPPKRKRPPMPVGYVKRIGVPKNDAIYALDLETSAPLRQIGWAEYKAGLGAGIELAEIAALPGNPKHPFDDLVRERGVIMVDGYQRPRPVASVKVGEVGAGYDLINWNGLAVSRPKG